MARDLIRRLGKKYEETVSYKKLCLRETKEEMIGVDGLVVYFKKKSSIRCKELCLYETKEERIGVRKKREEI